jgi:hypothetical protein
MDATLLRPRLTLSKQLTANGDAEGGWDGLNGLNGPMNGRNGLIISIGLARIAP